MADGVIIVSSEGRDFEVFWDAESEPRIEEYCPACAHRLVYCKYTIDSIYEDDVEIEWEDDQLLYEDIVLAAYEILGDGRFVCHFCEDAVRGDVHEDDFC